jgi:hypothetical protein
MLSWIGEKIGDRYEIQMDKTSEERRTDTSVAKTTRRLGRCKALRRGAVLECGSGFEEEVEGDVGMPLRLR